MNENSRWQVDFVKTVESRDFVIPTVRRKGTSMRFSTRSLMMCVSVAAFSSAVVAYLTHDFRKRMRIEADLISMGACRVCFDDESRPKYVAFAQPLRTDRIALYNPIDQLDLTDSHITDATILNMRRLFLRTANFNGSDLSDRQLELLPNVRCISFLYLQNTNVSDASITALSSIERLNYLDARGTRITPNGAERLIKLVPGLTVEL